VSDTSLRQLERHASESPTDAARYLQERVRSGNLSTEDISLAAALGHPAALLVSPECPAADWSAKGRPAFLCEVSVPILFAWSCDISERALDRAERHSPRHFGRRGKAARSALRLAKSLSAHESVAVAANAADALTFNDERRDAVADAADSAINAAFLYCQLPVDAYSYARDAVAHADAVVSATIERRHGRRTNKGRREFLAEQEWMRLRLAAWILGEVGGR
jgi:hypothetical protein